MWRMLLRRPAELLATLTIAAVAFGLLRHALSSNPTQPGTSEVVSIGAGSSVARFTAVTAVGGIIVIVPLAYYLAYVVTFHRPRWRWPLAVLMAAGFMLPYYTILQSILAWIGTNGILTAIGSQFVSGPTTQLAAYPFATASAVTVVGYPCRYLPLAFLLMLVAMRRLSPTVMQAAVNHGLSTWGVHSRIVLGTVRSTVALLVVFLFVTLAMDAASVHVLARGSHMTAGSMLEQAERAPTLLPLASRWALLLLIVATSAIACLLHLTRDQPEHSAERSDGATHSVPAGLGGRLAHLAVLAAVLSGALCVAAGLILLSLGFTRSSTGFFSAAPSLDGYRAAVSDAAHRDALFKSLVLGSVVATAAVAAGVLSAWGTFYARALSSKRATWATDLVLLLPILVPAVCLGRAAGEARQLLPAGPGWDWLVCVLMHAGLFVCVPVVLVAMALGAIGHRCAQATFNMGLSEWQASLCLLRPGLPAIAAAWLAVFALSVNEGALSNHILGIATSDSFLGHKPLAVLLDQRRVTGLEASDFGASSVLLAITLLCLLAAGVLLARPRRSRRSRRIATSLPRGATA